VQGTYWLLGAGCAAVTCLAVVVGALGVLALQSYAGAGAAPPVLQADVQATATADVLGTQAAQATATATAVLATQAAEVTDTAATAQAGATATGLRVTQIAERTATADARATLMTGATQTTVADAAAREANAQLWLAGDPVTVVERLRSQAVVGGSAGRVVAQIESRSLSETAWVTVLHEEITDPVNDFVAKVEFTWTPQDGYGGCGLVFHDNGADRYFAGITNDRLLLLGGWLGDEWFLVNQYSSRLIDQADAANNVFLAVVVGERMQFFVNGGLVTDVTDSRLSRGTVGLAVSNENARRMTCDFRNAWVYALE
jgi:hypothetical protein